MEKTFDYYIEADGFHFKYAKGEPTLKGQEFHDYNEFLFFMGGKSYLISKNIQQELTSGSIVVIPKEHFHQFVVTEQENYTRCVLGFRETSEIYNLVQEVMNTIKVISAPDEKIVNSFRDLTEIVKSRLSDAEKKLFICSSITQLLILLKFASCDAITQKQTLSPLVAQALDIIDENFAADLSVSSIAQTLHTSASTLAHKFSKELNIPIYRYISKKRLAEAHRRIENGETYTQASLNCGFSDYSCFYRLYKKYYLS